MVDCDSDEETRLARGRLSSTNQVSCCLSENLSEEHCREMPKSDIVPFPYALSPIYQLPVDVLRSIFELYCQVELPVIFPLQFSPPQLIASKVCSAWRRIMLGNPIFWNKITITFHESTHYDQMVQVPHIWLSRAKDAPCFIHFSSFLRSYSALMLSAHPIWRHDINKNIVRDLIASHRCKSLGVIFSDYHLHDLLELPNEKLASIEDLRLCHVRDENSHETVALLDFQKLTNLTSLSLKAFVSHHGHPIMVPSAEDPYFQRFSCIPWHQLRHIHIDIRLSVLRCLTILETSSSILETCSLFVSENLSITTSPLSQIMPIHCQQLREFKVHINAEITLDVGDSFLLLLRLPKLKSLELHYYHKFQGSTDFLTLSRMHSVCTMRLEKLIISGFSCDLDAGALLTTMPSLRTLELPERSIVTVDAIRKLGAGSIGPLLEELTINNTDEIGELIQMVKTRSSTEKENSTPKSTPTPFKSVLLSCDDPDGLLRQKYDATIDEINELGVELTVEFLDRYGRC